VNAPARTARLFINGKDAGEVTDVTVTFADGSGPLSGPTSLTRRTSSSPMRIPLMQSFALAVWSRRLGLMLAAHYRELARRDPLPGGES
jgi:hypothetical protein